MPAVAASAPTAPPRLLLVDDDPDLRAMLSEVLQLNHFNVTVASSVPEALKHITSNSFDVLLSDLHMPGAGDGLTVISAMRHANPNAVSFLLSAFPEMVAATRAIQTQADEILTKPVEPFSLVTAIHQRLASGPSRPRAVEAVATILERSVDLTIQDWYRRLSLDHEMMAIPMTMKVRTCHLPQIFNDLVNCLRFPAELGSRQHISIAAANHGTARYQQGYTAAMMVEESRILQVSIFQCLENNLNSIDFSLLLHGVMTIADEVDSQLAQAMRSFIKAESVARSIAA